MIIQDMIIVFCNILFSYALMPQVYYGFKHKKSSVTLQTSFLTTIGLYILSITFLTLKLYFSSIISLVTGTLWAMLLIQGILYKNR